MRDLTLIKKEIAKHRGEYWLEELCKYLKESVNAAVYQGFNAETMDELRYWRGRADGLVTVLNILLPKPINIKQEVSDAGRSEE